MHPFSSAATCLRDLKAVLGGPPRPRAYASAEPSGCTPPHESPDGESGASDRTAAGTTRLPDTPSAADPLRVLFVEDSELDTVLMLRELERAGFAVVWRRVDTVAAVVAALEQGSWEIMLADFSLPGFSGLDAVELVRARGLDLPCILVSGVIGEETAVAAMHAGISDYLLKDRLARLGPAVRRALRDAGERRARRQAESHLRRLYHAVEQCPAIVMITDPQGRIEYVNPRFTAVSGYALEEVCGRNPKLLKSGQTTPSEYDRLWKTISSGGEWRGELANQTKQGRVYWEAAAISPVRDSTGRITNYVKVAEDITEQRRTEELLRKLESHLRQAQKMEAIGELAGGVAHDFNSYLGAIIINAQLAQAACAAGAAASEHLDRIIAAGRQAAGLARQMLTFSRRDEQPRRPLLLGPVVEEALRLLRATLPAQVRLEVDIPAAGRTVLADATQVQEAFVNLWTNACHACRGSSSGRIAVSLKDVDVAGDASGPYPHLPPGPYVGLTVRDNGCGMSPELQERIFEPFFTTKAEGEGTGLGLPVVRRIMLAHQGTIVVQSRPQEGTAVHLLFPECASDAASSGPPETSPRGRGQRILLVDDHAVCRDAVQRLLESLGYRVTAFGSSLEALAAFRARAGEFDLVLTDLSMREMNGAELARQLLAAHPEIPVILSTGYELEGAVEHLHGLGVRDVLTKPIPRNRLAESVARALSAAGTANK